MHVHFGIAFALSAFFSVILVGGLWRVAALRLKDTAFGQAMAFLY